MLRVHGARDGERDVGEHHAGERREPQRSAPPSIDEESAGDGAEEVPDLHAAVDAGLGVGAADADAGQDGREVVGDDALAVPEREQSYRNADPEALSVGGVFEELGPGVWFEEFGRVDCGGDLGHFEIHERVRGGFVGVVSTKYLFGLGASTFGVEPSWGLGDERNCEDHKD